MMNESNKDRINKPQELEDEALDQVAGGANTESNFDPYGACPRCGDRDLRVVGYDRCRSNMEVFCLYCHTKFDGYGNVLFTAW